MTNGNRPVVVRIAPSPTGDPHVGTAYIALFNYVFARKHGGKFILRIEDTDRTRSRPEWEIAILRSLRWLGLSWDEGPDVGGPNGPYRQSERAGLYQQYAEELVRKGWAYRCFCTAEELEEARKRQLAAKENLRYAGTCRHLSLEEQEEKLAKGMPYVIRLKVPQSGTTSFTDRLRGEISFENEQIDDQVLLKSDGFPTYHLANVVDDHLMGVSHVIRAEEWISSTPKHVLLYEAFGWEAPVWIHLPLLRNQDRSKISKRKNPVSLTYYERGGYLPQAMLNYLGMMGWTMPNGEEKFSLQEMIDNFTWDRLSLGGPVFDLQKLIWLNGRYIRENLSDDELLVHIKETVLPDDYLRQIMPLIHGRIDKFEDFIDATSFFFSGSVTIEDPSLLIPKKRERKETVKVLDGLTERFDREVEWNVEGLERLMRNYAEEVEWKTKELFMPVRLIVTGRKATPPLFDTMAVLGREVCRRRMREAIDLLKKMKD